MGKTPAGFRILLGRVAQKFRGSLPRTVFRALMQSEKDGAKRAFYMNRDYSTCNVTYFFPAYNR
jgi:hypothetical protein